MDVKQFNPYAVVELCAFIISAISIFLMMRGQKHSGISDYNKILEIRLASMEERIKRLEQENELLRNENITLLRRLAKHENN